MFDIPTYNMREDAATLDALEELQRMVEARRRDDFIQGLHSKPNTPETQQRLAELAQVIVSDEGLEALQNAYEGRGQSAFKLRIPADINIPATPYEMVNPDIALRTDFLYDGIKAYLLADYDGKSPTISDVGSKPKGIFAFIPLLNRIKIQGGIHREGQDLIVWRRERGKKDQTTHLYSVEEAAATLTSEKVGILENAGIVGRENDNFHMKERLMFKKSFGRYAVYQYFIEDATFVGMPPFEKEVRKPLHHFLKALDETRTPLVLEDDEIGVIDDKRVLHQSPFMVRAESLNESRWLRRYMLRKPEADELSR